MSEAPEFRYCPVCAHPLAWIWAQEDGGAKQRLRCTACGFTHWNNPTPVLAAVVECTDRGGQLLLARNAAWSGRLFALITGFMEAGESAEEGIGREVLEETGLTVESTALIGVYDFQRLNQVIMAYHVRAYGEIRLSPELAEYRLFTPEQVLCWPQGTGPALAHWLRQRGIEPRFMEWPQTR
ncbi:NUDIX domain-containing protein [Ideonella sp. B7]|uniref:NUDIX domain-containing protein n=1 Tax=Ideonella benzenivorans TaxID=2831643 RepID=UPI001CEC5FFD|nr:NUDIX domain-containing protein [Ideonella benzenivorans]MCA6216059.1 NUDIX domain-containing protein [Ideonella benzenivorans]